MNCFTDEQLNRISHLVREIEKLTDVEKLYLYLQLPCGRAEAQDSGALGGGLSGKQLHLNAGKPGVTRIKISSNNKDDLLFAKKPDQETTQTYTWILSHLEVDPNVSLPKQEVYDEYRAFCQANRFEPLCVADFGKAMKHAFPCIKPRRLGQRGNSRYCYSGLRKKYKMQPPNLPEMIEPTFCIDNDCSQAYSQIIRDCRDNPNECPLYNKSAFSGSTQANEVINLKIEQQHNFHQLQTSATNNTHTGTSTDAGSSQYSNQQRPTGQHALNNQVGADQLVPAPTHRSAPVIIANSNYVHADPAISNSNAPSCNTMVDSARNAYSYFGQMPRSGTPDDDDYLHNYQNTMPNNRHLFSHQHALLLHQQQQLAAPQSEPIGANQGSCLDYQQRQQNLTNSSQKVPHSQDKIDNVDCEQATSDFIGVNPSSSVTTVPAVTSIATTDSPANPQQQPHIHFSHVSHMMDSCASPFQSPASTPYPMSTSSYMSSDMHDYYQGDCIRYGNS